MSWNFTLVGRLNAGKLLFVAQAAKDKNGWRNIRSDSVK